MLQRNNRWPASVLGVMLYTLVFIFAHHFWSAATAQAVRGQPELLLFLLPGIVMALLQPDSPLIGTLWIALGGTLLGMTWVWLVMPMTHSWLLVTAWSLSALFWAGCGALLVRLLRIMLAMRTS
ncbi:inner membrane protein YbjM [Pantoea dispersa]|uniref:inner membrane protein YbjM n=1 Tax=Pantoea dispersa TaxID=59814 RepID=UPI002DB607F4|nr:inner membrane protein YbjM [Pantoea dispersa]MEB5970722.1 inner membrane protein YbjM [Pantoea dispersa]